MQLLLIESRILETNSSIFRYLPKGLEQATTHHRLSHYAIGEIEYHMYHESDVYMADLPASYLEQSFDDVPAHTPTDFANSDQTIGISSLEDIQHLAHQDVKVELRGPIIEDAMVVDLWARAGDKTRPTHFNSRMPQTWLTNADVCIVGRTHNKRHKVDDVEVHNLVPLYSEWEDKVQVSIRISLHHSASLPKVPVRLILISKR